MIYAITDKDDELVKVEYFPAGEQKIVNDFKGRIVYGFRWIYENDAELFTLYCLTKMRNFYGLFLDMPYIGHARMDRVKTEKDVFGSFGLCCSWRNELLLFIKERTGG